MSTLRVYFLVFIYVINISTVNGGQCSYYFDESTGFPFPTGQYECSNITITSSKTRSTEYQCGAVLATRVYKNVFYNSNCGGQPKTSVWMKCSAPDCVCSGSKDGRYCNQDKFRYNTDSDPSSCSIPTTGELSSQILTIVTDTCINKRIFSKSSDGHLLINTYDNNGCTSDSISDVNQCYEYIAPTASPTSKPTTAPPTTSAFPTVAPLPTISPSPTISTTSLSTTPEPTSVPTNKPTAKRIFSQKPTSRTWTTGTTSTTNASQSSSATFLQDYKGYFIVCIVGIMVIGTLCSICCMMRKYRKRQLNEVDADHARNLIENDAELKKEGIQNDNGIEHEVDEIEIPGKLIKGKDKKKSKKKRNKYINFNDPNGELNINYVAHNEVCGDDNDTDDGAVIDDDDIPAAAYSDFTNEQTEDNYDEEIEISEGNEGMMDYDDNNDNTEESDNMDKDQVEVEMEDVNEDKEEDEVNENELSDKE